MNNAVLINQTSGDYEWYTPEPLIAAARKTMGSIDLDPASSVQANQRVRASTFYTEEMDGLSLPWFGNVFLNHPFGRTTNKAWIDKLCASFTLGFTKQSINLCFCSSSEAWFQPLYNFPICFISPRVHYVLPDGSIKKGCTKGSVAVYMGNRIGHFIDNFSKFGRIMIPEWRVQPPGECRCGLYI
ncbi:MAG: DNA N-6-adenine-methyltransferase [Chloroflexota bacterium]